MGEEGDLTTWPSRKKHASILVGHGMTSKWSRSGGHLRVNPNFSVICTLFKGSGGLGFAHPQPTSPPFMP